MLNWSNKDNIAYYESIPIETLRKYAVIGGFENGCDINIIYNYIKNATSILEVGAGYGRVLRNVIERGYRGKLFAIERSENFYQYLKLHSSKYAKIIRADINQHQSNQKFEVILWMWSNISDFSKDEHLSILKRLISWLTKKGIFIMDTISHTAQLADNFLMKDQNYIEKTDFGSAYGYIPSSDEIDNYAHKLGFDNIEHIEYNTDTKRPRIIHIFRK